MHYNVCLNENKRKVLLMYWDIPQHLKKKKKNKFLYKVWETNNFKI